MSLTRQRPVLFAVVARSTPPALSSVIDAGQIVARPVRRGPNRWLPTLTAGWLAQQSAVRRDQAPTGVAIGSVT